MIKAKFVWVGLITLALLSVSINTQNNTQSDCSSSANSYWTGYRCACKVGYKNQSNVCVPLTLLKTQGWVVRQPAVIGNQTQLTNPPVQNETVVNTNCYLPFEYYNGQGCVCLDGYARVNGLCQATGAPSNNSTKPPTVVTCPANSVLTNGECVCNSGFTKVNGLCIQSSKCGANSYDNGLGFCVCNSGFYKATNGSCLAGTACPPSSSRNDKGECVCDAGLTKYGDYCAKCPLGAIFDNATQKCVYVCGENSAYNTAQQKCLCLTGYGITNKVCAKCPANYFVQNNYCVTCPVNSVLSATTKRCECADGFMLSKEGVCVKKCANNEVYNTKTGACDCFVGLGKVNGICQICPAGKSPIADGSCGSCGVNQQLVDGQCICISGFIPNALKVCTKCSDVNGAFLINGACATCPGDLVYNGQKCACPNGFTKVGVKCKQSCKTDQLVDDNGLCYKCPFNEIISDAKCVCRNNYVRNNATGSCVLTCPAGQFQYQGRCAQCPLNLQYRAEIKGCACPDGLYLNNYGVCEKVVLAPVTCDAGFFFDSSKGCVACPAGCKSCSSDTVCTACTQNGFSVVNGVCQAQCGDGLIAGTEQCDDRNRLSNDGCSSTCQIETLWACTGQPSVCTYNGPAVCGNGRIERGEECDDGNLINGDGCSNRCQKETAPTTPPTNNTGSTARGLSLVGNVNTNINNVFVVLKTDKKFSFTNENEMESFLKTKFPDSSATPSVYCSQREAPDLDLFDCLAIYSSGVPNQKYKIQFSYNYKGDSGFISVDVDPLASSFATRSRGQAGKPGNIVR